MKKLIKYLLGQFNKRQISILLLKKIRKIKISLNKAGMLNAILNPELKEKHKKLWSCYGSKIDFSWLRIYISVSEISDYRYIPENIYYSEIEPRLNNKTFSKAYTDKNNYHKLLDNDLLPSILLRSISGIFYTQEYLRIENINHLLDSLGDDKKYIIKPSIEGGGGFKVRKVELNNKQVKITPAIQGVNTLLELVSYYERDFILQEYIEQHVFFSQFNPDSLNTVRILTYRSLKNEEIKILHKILRFGKAGSIVDNQASGGVACSITDGGFLADFGIDKFGGKHYISNTIKLSKADKIPCIEQIVLIAKEAAKNFLYSRLLGMDFAVDKNGKIYLIEVNDSSNEINFYQMNNGPLFGDYSEEVASLCHKEPKSFLLDFYL